jgi:hypothetical protein
MRKTILAVAVAGGALIPGLALADAREDVINSLTRCASLTEDRQWLDCYYGAAQPMRAWLGLSPAPQSQLKLLQTQPQPSVLPATVSRATVRSGPPPKPKSSGLFDVFGGDDVVNQAPVQSYEIKSGALSSLCPMAKFGSRPTTMPLKIRSAGVSPPQACG